MREGCTPASTRWSATLRARGVGQGLVEAGAAGRPGEAEHRNRGARVGLGLLRRAADDRQAVVVQGGAVLGEEHHARLDRRLGRRGGSRRRRGARHRLAGGEPEQGGRREDEAGGVAASGHGATPEGLAGAIGPVNASRRQSSPLGNEAGRAASAPSPPRHRHARGVTGPGGAAARLRDAGPSKRRPAREIRGTFQGQISRPQATPARARIPTSFGMRGPGADHASLKRARGSPAARAGLMPHVPPRARRWAPGARRPGRRRRTRRICRMLSRFLNTRTDLTRSDDPFQQLQRELGRVVEDVVRGMPASVRGGLGAGFAPSLDVRETPQGLELTAELPGMAEADIDLSLEGEVLTLRGEKREERKAEERGAHIQERSFGSFQRSLRLPFAPEPGAVTASFERGVLHVALPRPAQQAQRDNRIPIRGAAPAAAGAGGQAPETPG